jgi:adenylate cyclase
MKAQNPEKKEGSIFFCDIRNFTYLFDEKDPFEAVEFANTVLAVLGEEVEANGGTVDRFTGDGFLAHFGFEKPIEYHAEQACKAAIAIREKLSEINTNQLEQVTVLGDTVNTAARIEEMTKYFMVDVLVSDATYSVVRDNFSFRKMPLKTMKGKKKTIQTHWLLPTNKN